MLRDFLAVVAVEEQEGERRGLPAADLLHRADDRGDDPPGCTTPISGNGGGTSTAGNGGSNGVAGLPFTGFELGATALLGAGLLGAGALTIASGRKRKAPEAS